MIKPLFSCIMLLCCESLLSKPAFAQAAPPPAQSPPSQTARTKALTSDQLAYQQALAQWLDRYNTLRHRAKLAHSRRETEFSTR